MLDIDSRNLKFPYLIHSDIFRAFSVVKESFKATKERVETAHLHFELLCGVFGKENLIFPGFNYDFPKSRIYDTQKTPSQVGTLANYVLENHLLERTKTPIFSFLTDIPDLLRAHNYPFSSGSTFDYLYTNDGTIVFYGTDITSCTYLHFVENQFGPPLFRYDKKLTGTIVDKGTSKDVFVEFHARPLGLVLDYDWNFLFQLLIDKNVVVNVSSVCFCVKARHLSEVWGELFSKNQFDILTRATKEIVRAKYNLIGRRFVCTDFEDM